MMEAYSPNKVKRVLFFICDGLMRRAHGFFHFLPTHSNLFPRFPFITNSRHWPNVGLNIGLRSFDMGWSVDQT